MTKKYLTEDDEKELLKNPLTAPIRCDLQVPLSVRQNFVIKLRNDRIGNASKFFRLLIQAYLDGNPEIMKIYSKCEPVDQKELAKTHRKAYRTAKSFGLVPLSESEVTNIFDLVSTSWDF